MKDTLIWITCLVIFVLTLFTINMVQVDKVSKQCMMKEIAYIEMSQRLDHRGCK